ncbi:MAG: Holliday junction branch migration protein RuvA [Clostridia bacterium]|nr:Holliday junction branch migration protein RuvA [Clostridia bacterium]
MIGYIKGQVDFVGDGYVLLDNGGIGYEIFVSSYTLSVAAKNPYIQLYTHLNVREDGITLYGFATKEEKYMFSKLITISGVGPKAAISILSGIELNALMVAIINQDVRTLSKIKGIGKKTAERIVLELKENLDSSVAADTAITMFDFTDDTKDELSKDQDAQDAIYALQGLGFKQQEAVNAVKKARPLAKNLQELIALSLRSLN